MGTIGDMMCDVAKKSIAAQRSQRQFRDDQRIDREQQDYRADRYGRDGLTYGLRQLVKAALQKKGADRG